MCVYAYYNMLWSFHANYKIGVIVASREQQVNELEQIILACIEAMPKPPDGMYNLRHVQGQVLIELQTMNREYGADISTSAFRNLFEKPDEYGHAALKSRTLGNENA